MQSPFRHYPFQNLSPGYGFFGATSKSEYSFRGGSPHVHVAERLDKKCIASSRRDGWNCGRIPQRCCSRIAPPALARWAAICGTSPGSSAKKFGGGTWDANKLAANFGMGGDVYGHMVFVFQCGEFLWGFKKSPVFIGDHDANFSVLFWHQDASVSETLNDNAAAQCQCHNLQHAIYVTFQWQL